jgi:hypothetical protein
MLTRLDTHTFSALPLGSVHSALGGEVTGAGACPRRHCRLAACPGDRILRSRIRIRSHILGSNHFAFQSLAAVAPGPRGRPSCHIVNSTALVAKMAT